MEAIDEAEIVGHTEDLGRGEAILTFKAMAMDSLFYCLPFSLSVAVCLSLSLISAYMYIVDARNFYIYSAVA